MDDIATRSLETERAVIRTPVASVLKRAAAFALDYVVVFAYLVLLRLLAFLLPGIRRSFDNPSTAHAAAFLVLTLPVAAYFAISEASTAKAMLGKRLMRIQVENYGGARLSLAAATLRTAVQFAPWELSHAAIWRIRFGEAFTLHSPAGIFQAAAWGLVLASAISIAIDQRRRAIYDFAAHSVVVDRLASSSPDL
jgi:uncharacterized RDD family membrane protein YckC